MNLFRMPQSLWDQTHRDLDRPHPFAWERVGFLRCEVASLPQNGILVCAAQYFPVADDDYVRDSRAAAMLGGAAFRKILQVAYAKNSSIFHVHRHDGIGRPVPSDIDLSESKKFVPDFFKVCPHHPHGTIILSGTSLTGSLWLPGSQKVLQFDRLSVVGDPIRSGGKS